MKRTELTSRIVPPKYKVGRFTLNEYEVRELLARVSEGKLDPGPLVIEDCLGVKATIDEHGNLSNRLSGMDLIYKLSIRRLY